MQLGLTATPRRKDNADTYAYFGDPVFIYSLKERINDGFLTPFKVKQISTTLDDYVYAPDDQLIEGEIETGKRYTETDFNKIIEIKEREGHRVKVFMEQINQNEKTLVFCATQDHALAVRDLINQMKTSKDPNYCQRVTANDGALGEQHSPRRFASFPSGRQRIDASRTEIRSEPANYSSEWGDEICPEHRQSGHERIR